jgi:hypothetical protein
MRALRNNSRMIARNLKLYPLALKLAIGREPAFTPLRRACKITTCDGREKALFECTTWELLNLVSEEILNLPSRICAQFSWSVEGFESVLRQYLVQSLGLDGLQRHFEEDVSCVIMASSVSHYSWLKGAGERWLLAWFFLSILTFSIALTGVGSLNAVVVPVDSFARLDCSALDKLLANCVFNQRSVYVVVATIGTTEHGAVDSLSQILALRRKYRAQGLSFLIHVDGAFGGYFCSLLRSPGRTPMPSSPDSQKPPRKIDTSPFLPRRTLYELEHVCQADSATVDPHKSGYIPFPAGGICYRDGRLRYLLTWTSPVLGSPTEDAQRIGLYGVEGRYA